MDNTFLETGRELHRGDCLEVLKQKSIIPDESIDLIYLDPPFNSNQIYNLPFKGQKNSEHYGTLAAFHDTWEWEDAFDNEMKYWHLPDECKDIVNLAKKVDKTGKLPAYLYYMAERLWHMKRVLKDTGSLYLHCDHTASHYLKMLMDILYGKENFRNEIVWKSAPTKNDNDKIHFPNQHNIILFYTKTDNLIFNEQYEKLTEEHIRKSYTKTDAIGRFMTAPLHCKTNQGGYASQKIFDYKGLSRRWMYSKENLDKMESQGLLFKTKTGDLRKKVYLHDTKGTPTTSLWFNIPPVYGKERLGYPTQKPLALLESIIKASSNEGDVILDPFCGCGTTVHAAEKLNRKWIGIDIAPFSVGLVKNRLFDAFHDREPNPLLESDVKVHGMFLDIMDARKQAKDDPWEFEKTACALLYCEKIWLGKRPGDKGCDGGVDGAIKLAQFFSSKDGFVVVQVKSGKVTVDSVKALKQTVDEIEEAVMGILVCFEDQMTTVKNKSKAEVEISGSFYDVIQGYSIETLIKRGIKDLHIPPRYAKNAREHKRNLKQKSFEETFIEQ